MSTEKVRVVLDIEAEIGKIEGALKTLRGDMSNLQLPKGIGKEFENRMSKLSDEIKNFHNLASKMGNSLEGAGKIDASYKKILEYARKVENSLTTIKEEAGIDATKFFPKEIVDRIEKAEQAMKDYEAAVEKGKDAYKQEINDLKAVEKQLDNLRKKQISLEGTKTSKKTTLSETKERQKQVVQQANLTKQASSQEQVAIQKRIALLKEEKEAVKAVQKAQEESNKTKTALESVKGYDKGNLTQQKSYDSKKRNDDEARANLQRAQEAAKAYGNTLRSIPDIEAEIAAQNQALKQQETIYNQADVAIKKVNSEVDKASMAYNKANQELQDNANQINQYVQEQERLNNAIKSGEAAAKNGAMNALANALKEINIIIDPTTQSLEEVKTILNNLKPEAIQQLSQALKNTGTSVDELELGLTELGNKNKVFQEGAQYTRQMNNQMEQLKGHVQQFFSLTNSVMLFRRGIQKAFEAVKELDAAMTETAVVTDFSVGDMWDQLPRYTAAANELGTTTLGAYETMTLFYQQGLETNEVFEIGTETMKMARIAGLDYANATDLMTAALRGFNMELNETSATRINDVYSELAAITAADTEEIANAMTKTASIAANANMEFETTAALLSQIIETTREPAETAGTAMKTIIARFTEMKKASSEVINVDGEEVNVNKVEAALKSAGVALRDVNGEFRDLDDVFLELSSKWNGLDKMTQRYVATMAAGSRQQSRFIAMMQDYDRTMELVDAAYNSSGASQKQFEKTQDSLESKINRLKNAWNEFLMGIANSDVIKAGVDALTGLLNVINKLTGKSGIAKLSVAILGLKTGSAIFNGLFKAFTPLKGMMNKQGEDVATGFISGLTQRINNFRQGKPFVLDVDVDTKGIKRHFNNIKTDWSNLLNITKQPFFPEETIIDFDKLNGRIVATSITAKGFNDGIQLELSQTGKAALSVSEASEEIGEDLLKSGLQGKTALDILQKEYKETLILSNRLNSSQNGTRVFHKGNFIEANSENRKYWNNRTKELQGDVKQLSGYNAQLTSSHSILRQLTPLLGKIGMLLGAIVGALALAYALVKIDYFLSAAGQLERQVNNLSGAVNIFNSQLEITQEELTNVNNLIDQLKQQKDALNGLIKGTSAWNQQLSEVNKTTFELAQEMGLKLGVDYYYDIGSGEYVIPEETQNQWIKDKETEIQKQRFNLDISSAYLDYLKKEQEREDKWQKYQYAVPQQWHPDAVYDGVEKYYEANMTHGEVLTLNKTQSDENKAIYQSQLTEAIKTTFSQDDSNGMAAVASDYIANSGLFESIYNSFIKENNVGGNSKGGKRNLFAFRDFSNDAASEEMIDNYLEEMYGDTSKYKIKGDKVYDLEGNLIKEVRETFYDEKDSTHISDEEILSYYATKNATEEISKQVEQVYNDLKIVGQIEGKDINLFEAVVEGNYADFTLSEMQELQYTGDSKYSSIWENYKNQAMQEIQAETDLIKSYLHPLGQEIVDNYSSQIRSSFANIITQLEDKQINSGMIKAISDQLSIYAATGWEEELKEIENINWESSIQGAKDLNKLIEKGSEEAKEMASIIKDGAEEYFGASMQFKELLGSEKGAEIQTTFSEILDKKGTIEASDIHELTEEYEVLDDLLEAGEWNALGLAKAFEKLSDGTIELTDLTEDYADALNNTTKAYGLIQKTISHLEEVDVGPSGLEIGEWYKDAQEALQNLEDFGAYNDPQLHKYMTEIFGDNWSESLEKFGGNAKKAYEEFKPLIDSMKGNLYSLWTQDELSGLVDINSEGMIAFDNEAFTTSTDLVNQIAEKLKVSKATAEAMVAEAQALSAEFATALQKQDAIYGLFDTIKSSWQVNANNEEYLFLDENAIKEYAIALDVNWENETERKEFLEVLQADAKKYFDIEADIEFVFDGKEKEEILDKGLSEHIQKFFIDNLKYKHTRRSRTGENKTSYLDFAEILANPPIDYNESNFSIDNSDQKLENWIGSTYTTLVNLDIDPTEAKNKIKTELTDTAYDIQITDSNGDITTIGELLEAGIIDSAVDGFGSSEVDAAAALQAAQMKQILYDAIYTAITSAMVNALTGQNAVAVGATYDPNTPGSYKAFSASAKAAGEAAGYGAIDTAYMGSDGKWYQDNSNLPEGVTLTGVTQTFGGKNSEEAKANTDTFINKQNQYLAGLNANPGDYDVKAAEKQLESTQAATATANAIRMGVDVESDEFKNLTPERLIEKYGSDSTAWKTYLTNTAQDHPGDTNGKNDKTEEKNINYGAENSDAQLEALDRLREVNEREADLISKLPEEIRPFFEMANLAEKMGYEYQEIQINKNKLGYLQQEEQLAKDELAAKGYLDKYMYYDEQLDEMMWNTEAMKGVSGKTRDDIVSAKEKYDSANDARQAVEKELDGGKIQDFVKALSKGAKDISKVLKSQGKDTKDVDKALRKLEKQLGLTEGSLQPLSDKFKEIVSNSKYLNSEFEGLSDSGDKMVDIFKSGPLGRFMSDETAEQLKNGGVTKGQMGGSILGDIGDALGFSGDLLNFDMMGMGMDMFNMGKGIMDQGKQMAEQVIGYITQATQVLVDAWTNREDYLYNFLQIIEKYLHDYEKMQRYSTQLEKGRMATVDDIRLSWEQQWQSLQEQLEMQQERLETRQQQLDMSRWNPFMLISGWNPETDALYENREVKMLWDIMIGAMGMLPMGLGAFGQQLNQLYEDYDKRVQEAYEDRLAAEMAILDIEDERLELVKVGSEETVEFQDKVMEAMVQKEQEQIDELNRLNEAITEANSKLISTLQSNLEQIRQDRENEKKEEELSEKQRRLSYLRQDTSGANAVEIKKLEEQLEEEHEDYTDTLIDQKISELEEQNELAAEQRQQQIDLLQAQLDWSEKYGLYWDAIYGMLYTIDENGNVILNPENFDLDGNIRENGELAKMLGTFTDQIGMSLWAQVLEMDELKRLGRYAGAFIGHNGLDGQWADYWALLDPGADDPDYAEPDPVIPDGLAGVLWKLEHGIREYFARSDGGLIDTFGHAGEKIANGLGDLFGIDSWSAYNYETVMRGDVGAPMTDFFVGLDRKTDAFFDDLLGRGNKYTQNLTNKGMVTPSESNRVGDNNFNFNVGTLLGGFDDFVDRVVGAISKTFSGNVLSGSQFNI